MKMLSRLKNAINQFVTNDDMARYYRTEYKREWEICKQTLPNFTDNEIVNICFKGKCL